MKFLSPSTVEDSLWTFFESCGTVERCKLLTDRDSGESKCIAFVDFEATEGTDAAVKLSNTELDGKSVVVDFNAPREKGEGKKGDGKKGDGKKGKGKGKGKGKKGKGEDMAKKSQFGGIVAGVESKPAVTFDSDSD